MRVVMIGVAHWHSRHYFSAIREMPEISIVGISDPVLESAKKLAVETKCPAWQDYREMCANLRPDFALVFGRHCDMAESAGFLIDQKIPFAIEKPGGFNAREVRDLARRAREAGLFAGAAFVMRHSPMHAVMREVAEKEKMHYLSAKMVGGLASRYFEYGTPWVLERQFAGGGCMMNLGPHLLDLCRTILRPVEPVVVGAVMSNSLTGCDVEDHAVILLKAGDATCYIETGYMYPSSRGSYDMHFSFRADHHYFIAHDAETFEISDDKKNRDIRKISTTNLACYPPYIHDLFARFAAGRPPIADLDDMAAMMNMVEASYAMSPLPPRNRKVIG